jgi:tRNA(Ile)-lysidine synthase
VSAAEADKLFAGLSDLSCLVLAVSGGPDSTALLTLAARWRGKRKTGPRLLAVTIDHALRPESAKEALGVKRLARGLGVAHRTVKWSGGKPKAGLQDAARIARYRLLGEEARRAAARHILTAHTLDDQAETVLFRLARGSGLPGLAAMASVAPLPVDADGELFLLRPFLGIPKARLIATLKAAKIPFADDPSNRDPRFTRPRLRTLMEALAEEGLSAERLHTLARRMRRADAAIGAVVARAAAAVSLSPWTGAGPIELDAEKLFRLPGEVVLRVIGAAIARVGNEGPVELGKLEDLCDAVVGIAGRAVLRRTLAGALVTLAKGRLSVERAPARRGGRRNLALTKAQSGSRGAGGRS